MKMLPLLLAASLFACGSKHTPPEKSAPPTATSAPSSTPAIPTTQSWKEAYKNIPASAAMVIRFAAPELMISSSKKLFAPLLSPEELAEAEMGVFFLRLFGVDPTRGVLFIVDGALSLKSSPEKDLPAMRFDIPLTNVETFVKGVKDYVTKKQPTFSIAEASAGGYALRYVYDEATPPTESQLTLRAVIFAKDTTASVFIFQGGSTLSRSALQEQLLQYVSKPVEASLADDPLFQSMATAADPMGSIYLFANTTNIFNSIPDSSFEDKALSARLVEAAPAGSFSFTLSDKGLDGGYAVKINPPTLRPYLSVFPKKEAPSYGTIFPSGTSAFYRSSLDLYGFKEALVELAPPLNPALFWKILTGFQDATGLGIEIDVLSALTGHFAVGLDVSMVNAETPKGPVPPVAFVVFQTTKETAGDTLLDKLADTIEQRLPERKIVREEIDGEPLYTSQSDSGTVIAAMRCKDLLLFGFGKEAIQEMCARVKTPGKYFTETTSNALVKQLVNAKTGNGFFMDMGSIMKTLTSAFPEKMADLELSKFSAMFGPFVSRSDYSAEEQLYFGTMEMHLRP